MQLQHWTLHPESTMGRPRVDVSVLAVHKHMYGTGTVASAGGDFQLGLRYLFEGACGEQLEFVGDSDAYGTQEAVRSLGFLGPQANDQSPQADAVVPSRTTFGYSSNQFLVLQTMQTRAYCYSPVNTWPLIGGAREGPASERLNKGLCLQHRPSSAFRGIKRYTKCF